MFMNFQTPIRSVWKKTNRRGTTGLNFVAGVRELYPKQRELTDSEILERVSRLRESSKSCRNFSELLCQGAAIFKEAARREFQIEYYDVQVLAATTLTKNVVVEMATGEGKTYVGAMAAFLHSLDAKSEEGGVHLMTTNSYLAERDFETALPIFQRVGLSAGLLRNNASTDEKRLAYSCDVTYGPGYEFGFDYLRDQQSLRKRPALRLGENHRNRLRGKQLKHYVPIQRGHTSAIIDEADSVLLDEANTPLLLSGPTDATNPHPEIFEMAVEWSSRLYHDEHFSIDPESNAPTLTASGISCILDRFENVSKSVLRRPWPEYIEQALFARLILKKNVDYVVRDETVRIVDQRTGRIFADRSWRGGLHQMVEAKEGVPITAENDPLAKISRQQYFRCYERLGGMTGTARGSEKELRHFYKLGVVAIPTRKPCQRTMLTTQFFANQADKLRAIVKSVVQTYQTGQPVLVGTRTIEMSEEIARQLDEAQVPCQVLNGKQDAEEAEIIACAGNRGMVTVATNMAGRGTDIKLGPGVESLGGLHVVITEPNESHRVDRQLAGRSARQGNPGSCQTFASADDEILAKQAEWFADYIRKIADENGVGSEDLTKTLGQIQRKIERKHFARRKKLFAQESWLEGVMDKLARTGSK